MREVENVIEADSSRSAGGEFMLAACPRAYGQKISVDICDLQNMGRRLTWT